MILVDRITPTHPLGRALPLALGVCLVATFTAADPAQHYAARCAACHNTPVDPKIPAVDALKRMNSTRVSHALSPATEMSDSIVAIARGRLDPMALPRYSFQSVNGIDGHGGAIDNPGVLAVDDLVFVTSGYGMFGQMPGNVLLVFELDRFQSASVGQAQHQEPAPAG